MCPFPWYTVPWPQTSHPPQTASRSVQPFFALLTYLHNTHTHRPCYTCDMCNNRPHAMRPQNQDINADSFWDKISENRGRIIQMYRLQIKIDGCTVLNEHNTVFASKWSAIRAQDVYFLHSTMISVTFLRLSDVSVIFRITYFQFPTQSVFLLYMISVARQHCGVLILIRGRCRKFR